MEYSFALDPDIIRQITNKKTIGETDTPDAFYPRYPDHPFVSQEYERVSSDDPLTFSPSEFSQIFSNGSTYTRPQAYTRIIFRYGCKKEVEEVVGNQTYVFTLDICQDRAVLSIRKYNHTNGSCLTLSDHGNFKFVDHGSLLSLDQEVVLSNTTGIVKEINEIDALGNFLPIIKIFVEKEIIDRLDTISSANGEISHITYLVDGEPITLTVINEDIKKNLEFEVLYRNDHFNCREDNLFHKYYTDGIDIIGFPDEINIEHRRFAKHILSSAIYKPGSPLYGLNGSEEFVLYTDEQSENPVGSFPLPNLQGTDWTLQSYFDTVVAPQVPNILVGLKHVLWTPISLGYTPRNEYFYNLWLEYVNNTETENRSVFGFGLQHDSVLSPSEWEQDIFEFSASSSDLIYNTGLLLTGNLLLQHSINAHLIKAIDNQYIPTAQMNFGSYLGGLNIDLFYKYRIGHHNKYHTPIKSRREIFCDPKHSFIDGNYARCRNLYFLSNNGLVNFNDCLNRILITSGSFFDTYEHSSSYPVCLQLLDNNGPWIGNLPPFGLINNDVFVPDMEDLILLHDSIQVAWGLIDFPSRIRTIDYYQSNNPTANHSYLERYPGVSTFGITYSRLINGLIRLAEPNTYKTFPFLVPKLSDLNRIINEVNNYSEMDLFFLLRYISIGNRSLLLLSITDTNVYLLSETKIIQELVDEIQQIRCVDFGHVYKDNFSDDYDGSNVWGENISYDNRNDFYSSAFGGEDNTVYDESDGFMLDIRDKLMKYSEGCILNNTARTLNININLDHCYLTLNNYQIGDEFTIVEQSGIERKYILSETGDAPEGYRAIFGLIFDQDLDLIRINNILKNILVTELFEDKIKIYQTRTRNNESLKINSYNGGVILTDFEEIKPSVRNGYCKGKKVNGTYVLEPTEIYGSHHCRLQYIGHEYFHIIETSGTSRQIRLITINDIEYEYQYEAHVEGYWSLTNYDPNCFECQVPRDLKII